MLFKITNNIFEIILIFYFIFRTFCPFIRKFLLKYLNKLFESIITIHFASQ